MDDILASIRKIIADDFSISERTATYASGGDQQAHADDGDRESEQDVLDLGKPSPLVHSLSGTPSRQIDSGLTMQAASRRDMSEFSAARMPIVTPLRGNSNDEAGDEPERQAPPPASDRHVRSVSERLSALHPGLRPESEDPLIGRITESSVSSAFRNLREISRKASVESRPAPAPPTLEAVVMEALRPMLRDWLEAHLPAIVEELVKAEIERLAERN